MTCYVIAGPTACGKSDLALKVAKECNGEIVCMDSMQIYRYMDIGTAKPTKEEQQEIPHHMLDIVVGPPTNVPTNVQPAGKAVGWFYAASVVSAETVY